MSSTDHWAKAVEAAMDGYVAPEEDGFGGGRPLITDMQVCMDAALRAALPHLVAAVLEECELSGVDLMPTDILAVAKEIAGCEQSLSSEVPTENSRNLELLEGMTPEERRKWLWGEDM